MHRVLEVILTFFSQHVNIIKLFSRTQNNLILPPTVNDLSDQPVTRGVIIIPENGVIGPNLSLTSNYHTTTFIIFYQIPFIYILLP